MIETQGRSVRQYESVGEYTDLMRAQNNMLWLLLVGLIGVVGAIFLGMYTFLPHYLSLAPMMSLGAIIVFVLPVAIWNNPRVGLYILLMSACLFTQTPAGSERDPFLNIPLFWNVSTAFLHYTGKETLSMLNFNLGELIMIITALSWLIRSVARRELKFHKGAFFGWLLLYILWCMFGFYKGIRGGGTTTFALYELRAQAYFFLAYLMAANLINDRKHVMICLWLMVIGIGLKSFVGTANYIKNPDVSADEGVMSHEDSLLMNIILFGAVLLGLAKVEPKLKWFCILLVPTALLASLANGRRAGIAAFIIAFPVIVALSAVLLRERRKQIVGFLVVFSMASAIYLPLAWNGKGVWALPARAIKSRSSPDARDAGSDLYRIGENYNLRATRDTAPWLGFGYGRPFLALAQMPGRIDPFTYILPHNGILWIWMRLGHIGFFLFWMFVATVLIRGPEILKIIRDPRLQVVGILTIAVFLMLIIYGQYDLAFANYRVMWLTGTLLGLTAALPRLVEMKREERTAQSLSMEGQGTGDDLDVREVGANEDEEPVDAAPSWGRNVPGWSRGADW